MEPRSESLWRGSVLGVTDDDACLEEGGLVLGFPLSACVDGPVTVDFFLDPGGRPLRLPVILSFSSSSSTAYCSCSNFCSSSGVMKSKRRSRGTNSG